MLCMAATVTTSGLHSEPAGAASPPASHTVKADAVHSGVGRLPRAEHAFTPLRDDRVPGLIRRHPDPAHRLSKKGIHVVDSDASESTNWSGWADSGSTFSGVEAEWTVPSVPASSTTKVSSTWVGIDGWDNQDLIQTGTTQAGVDGSTDYFVWYEILPDASVPIGEVSPGDEIEAEVVQDSGDTWTITIDDVTQDAGFSQNFSYSGPATSAEWIEEDPTNGQTDQLFPFADFGTVRLSDLSVAAADPGDTYLTPVVLVNSSGGVVCYPGAIANESFEIIDGQPPSVTTSDLAAGKIDVPYSATLSAGGGTAPYSWSIVSAAPPWLSLDPSTGGLSGTPTTAGLTDVTFQVTDTNGVSDALTLPVAVVNNPGVYVPLVPTRICDTRAGNPSDLSGAASQCDGETLDAGGTIDFDAAGSFGVPASNVTAVVLNVTEANASGSGFFTLFPTGAARPTASDLNFTENHAVPNLVEVGVGSSGQVSLYTPTRADAIVDLEGYVTTVTQDGAGLYDALPGPARICDTRGGDPSGLSGAATQCNSDTAAGSADDLVGPADPLTLRVTGLGGVPATGVEAVVVNVTAVKGQGAGYVTAYPAGSSPPTASNVNFSAGQAVANRVIVPVNATTGQVTLYSSTLTDLIVDISGYYTTTGGTGAEFTPEPAPVRICDTRGGDPSGLQTPYTQCNADTASGGQGNPVGAATSRALNSTGLGYVPSGATAAVVNLTAVAPSSATYLTVYPEGTPPTTSDLNPPVGGVLANLVVATLSGSGTFSIYNAAGSTNVLVDVAGWYTDVLQAPDIGTQSDLDTALTNAKAIFQNNSQTFPSSAAMVTALAAAVPSLTFTTGESVATGQISVTASGDGDGIILADRASGTDNCWYIVYNAQAESASSPWSGAGAVFTGAGTWFGEVENTGSPPTCQALRAPSGPNTAVQSFQSTDFPAL
jgi:hypothetical protein